MLPAERKNSNTICVSSTTGNTKKQIKAACKHNFALRKQLLKSLFVLENLIIYKTSTWYAALVRFQSFEKIVTWPICGENFQNHTVWNVGVA